MGKILQVDLTAMTMQDVTVEEDVLRRFVGGSGLGAYFLRKFDVADKDPFDPACPFICMTGPLTGTLAASSGRYEVITKSPLTGGYGEASSAGTWGVRLKQAGYDGVIVVGKAEKPVYIYIKNGKPEIRDAHEFWGLDTYELGDLVEERFGKRATLLCIGPGGERLSYQASILNDGRSARAAGRGGLGAVMGSKLLKAIIVEGNAKIPVVDPERLRESVRSFVPHLRKACEGMTKYGTISGTVALDANQDFPYKNWQGDFWPEGADKLSGMTMVERGYVHKNYHCAGCVVGCGQELKFEEGDFKVDGGGPEYESAALLGGDSCIDDLAAVCYATELCNRYGIDVIGVGGVIAFAREAYEKGHFHEYGIDLSWGSVQGMIDVIHAIGKNEGLGAILGRGSKYAAELIGGDAMDYAIQVKGMEFPGHDPRAYQSVALGYATSNRGACHLQAWSGIFENWATLESIGLDKPFDRFSAEKKPEMTADLQNLMSMFDSLCLCKYILFGIPVFQVTCMALWLSAVTGWDINVDEFMEMGERIYTMKRQFNVECGLSSKDDTLPKRIMTEPRVRGPVAGHLPKLDEMLPKYYIRRGWDEEGRPTKETLEHLRIPITPRPEIIN